ncbi:MAG TPA: hypothetical protein VGF94_20255 [Kofleriaceae bacterium]
MVPRYVRLVGALAVVGACGDAAIPLADLDTEALHARCERFVRCGLFTDQDACEGYFRIVVDVNRQPSMDAGLVHYDGEAAQRCYSALAAVTCDGTARDARVPPADCAKIFVGTIGDGDACENDLECKSGRCHVDTSACGDATCCSGTCASSTRAASGAACIDSTDCVADTYCGIDDVCHALGQAGGQCYVDANCDYGLRCSGSSPRICEPAGTLGNTCPNGTCAEIGSVCDASGACVTAGLPDSNAACASDAECSMYAICDPSMHVCVSYPTLGMPCDSHGCAGDSYCDMTATPAACAPPLDDLTPCELNSECASNDCVVGPVFDECQEQPVCK